ncbi:Oidioi.mRNA.OKI2018_I69.chr2.g4411.t1.cds [Oikopleura dioica]|uniref:Oidioi.mRNA.OKI2018_I69.chr2.g4411.t1.cds n=1 Tax=Oikopleura dioica TaxID=34765 RepID=A0ABN7T2U4_OIKDI|nr:Oidioi.mRNA.OKI2018_I69.chr2.g4411.t1.cds [Oikopleura dioica]
MFICCTAITICIKSESALDPRLNRVLPDGTIVAKNNTFTTAVSEVERHWFCMMLDESWFTDIRFTSRCAPVEPNKDGFQTKAKPFSDSSFTIFSAEIATNPQKNHRTIISAALCLIKTERRKTRRY